jgi:peptidoglycan/LPS O-acetylase OafA/YrhL
MNRNINELQLLRAFGILVVLIHHMDQNLFPWSSGVLKIFYSYFAGTAALDMFFVLSGFVITRLLVQDLGRAESRYHSIQISCIFWLRRAWRLLPAAWLWLVLAVFFSVFFNESGAFGPVKYAWGGALSAFLQVANLKLADCFLELYFCGPTFPYWSLSLEEQFYLILPLLLIFSGKWFLRIILVLAFTQFFIPFLTLPAVFRLQGFLLGTLLAFWSYSPTYKIFQPVFLEGRNWARWLVLCILLGLMCAMHHNIVPSFMLFQLSAIIGVLLVYIASFDKSYLWQDGWLKRFGLWLGSRAYSMYLCHIPLFYLTREIAYQIWPEVKLGPEHFWYLLLASMFMVVVLSELTYTLLEKPLRSKGMAITGQMRARHDAERKAVVDTK